MTHRHRRTLARLAAAALFALTACTPSTTASITPTPVATSASPTPSPTPTYGPNQTAAIAVVTGYYAWWNAARKNPRVDAKFKELATYWDLHAKAYGESIGDVSGLASLGYHQAGDMVVAQMIPTSVENASMIAITVCLDRTGTSLVNAAGTTVDPRDRQTGATIPSSQVFTRRVYYLETKPSTSGAWVITDLSGGSTAC